MRGSFAQTGYARCGKCGRLSTSGSVTFSRGSIHQRTPIAVHSGAVHTNAVSAAISSQYEKNLQATLL